MNRKKALGAMVALLAISGFAIACIVKELQMKPYSRRGKKTRINNRKKFNAGSSRVSWEYSPREFPPGIAPLILVRTRLRKACRQGLTKDQKDRYCNAMV